MLDSEFKQGDVVRVLRPIRNDGTYHGMPRGELLINRGSIGVVQDIGSFLQDQVIYAVRFMNEDRLVGCREQEVQAADAPWIPNRFDNHDRVRAARTFAVSGEIRAKTGEVGEVLRVLNVAEPVQYEVIFGDRILLVPETALNEM